MNAEKVLVSMWLHTATIKSTVGNKLGFFLARSTFHPAHVSHWPARSGATTSLLVAVLSAVLLRRMILVAT